MPSQPINLTATFFPKKDKVDEFVSMVREVTKKVQEHEPGVLLYYAFRTRGREGKDEIVFVEKYKDRDTFDAHVKTDYFQSFAKKLPELCERPHELKVGHVVGGFETRANL